MTEHADYASQIDLPESVSDDTSESSIEPLSPVLGKLHYWWSLFVAGALLLVIGPPTIFTAWLLRRRHWLYPWARFGAWAWLRLSGMQIEVRGLQHLDSQRNYVFISNHRSYLDTATLFYYTGRRIGIIAKKELLKVPILGYGMGYVNIMAIDRSNRERAIKTMRAATDRIRSGVSFGVFAEGTRAPVGGMLPFKKGAFYMAIEAGAGVVPTAISNTDKLMGKGTGVSRPGKIIIEFLPPVETDEYKSDDDVIRLIQIVHGAIARKLGLEGRATAVKQKANAAKIG